MQAAAVQRPHAILFDVDDTLVETGGAGGESWRRAFRDLYDVDVDADADVKSFSELGETDPVVGRRTFQGLFGRPPEPAEMAQLMTTRLEHICSAVADSDGYRVLPGAEQTLSRLAASGYLLGLTTGNVEAAAFAKLHRGGLHRFLLLRWLRL